MAVLPSGQNVEPEVQQEKGSWFKKTLIGRTPSLPSSLGKKKQSFFKKFSCRKISAPSFASSLRHLNHHHHHHHKHKEDNEVGGLLPQEENNSTSLETASAVRPAEEEDDEVKCGCGGQKRIEDKEQNSTMGHLIVCSSLEEALPIIEDLRVKCNCRGQQIIGYRKKLRTQRTELNQTKADHRSQLEDISAQLLVFESSLRAKEKKLQQTLAVKDQVILKQQRVIKRLLKKIHNNETGGVVCEDELISQTASLAGSSGSETTTMPSDLVTKKIMVADYDAQNDSDSAIMLEDSITEVSVSVPNLRSLNSSGGTNGNQESDDCNSTTEVKVIRSISDVVKVKDQAQPVEQPQQGKQLSGRKTKEERRISNRQKLLSLKRHSGFLKRPEILETVYSVEEDSESAQQQIQQQQQQQQAERDKKRAVEASSMWSPRSFESPSLSRRGSNNSGVVLTGFRYRLDSTTCSEGSTDDESTRLFCSESESCCSCSQPCSRRSSLGYAYACPCMQCGGGGAPVSAPATASFTISASAPASRRSSYGSSYNNSVCESEKEIKTAAAPAPAAAAAATTFNRVMTNHRTVVKPKDVKFKRINKAKSRSLEELRGKLKWPLVVGDENYEEDEDDDGQGQNRLALLRELMQQHMSSLSLDHETTHHQSTA